jgi:hypothetical protein
MIKKYNIIFGSKMAYSVLFLSLIVVVSGVSAQNVSQVFGNKKTKKTSISTDISTKAILS